MKLVFTIIIIFCLTCNGFTQETRKQTSKQTANPTKPSQLNNPTLSSREIIDKVSKALVLIVTQDKDGEPVARGSGFFIEDDLVATNLHVFQRASQGYIKYLQDGLTYQIDEIIRMDLKHDLCVFRVKGVKAIPLPLSSPNKTAIGDEVYVAGNPKGLEGTFSKGIISSIRSEYGLLQIDAAISSGSSGGPVVNNQAEVVGVVVSALSSGQNLNFAIPVSFLCSLSNKWQVPVAVAGAFALNDLHKSKLKGSVKSVTIKTAQYGYNKNTGKYFEKPTELSEVKSFNPEGYLNGITSYSDGEVFTKIQYEYNEQGFISRTISTFKNGQPTSKEWTDEESINERANNAQYSTTDEAAYTDKNGNKITIMSTTYDRFGNNIETFLNRKDGPIKTTRSFDKEGKVIEERTFTNGKLTDVARYSYEIDEHGNWVKQYCESYSPEYEDLGYTPSSVTYRNITYQDK